MWHVRRASFVPLPETRCQVSSHPPAARRSSAASGWPRPAAWTAFAPSWACAPSLMCCGASSPARSTCSSTAGSRCVGGVCMEPEGAGFGRVTRAGAGSHSSPLEPLHPLAWPSVTGSDTPGAETAERMPAGIGEAHLRLSRAVRRVFWCVRRRGLPSGRLGFGVWGVCA